MCWAHVVRANQRSETKTCISGAALCFCSRVQMYKNSANTPFPPNSTNPPWSRCDTRMVSGRMPSRVKCMQAVALEKANEAQSCAELQQLQPTVVSSTLLALSQSERGSRRGVRVSRCTDNTHVTHTTPLHVKCPPLGIFRIFPQNAAAGTKTPHTHIPRIHRLMQLLSRHEFNTI